HVLVLLEVQLQQLPRLLVVVDGEDGALAGEVHRLASACRCSANMLQNSCPCSIASSSATWVCGLAGNQRLGMRFLVDSRYGSFSIAIAKVLMSSAEWLNGL